MDAATFRDEVEEAKATELDRLGSQQSLVALTAADLDAEAVLRAAAQSEHTARETFAEWAETEEDAKTEGNAKTDEDAKTGDAAASETFASLADQESDHYDRVTAELDGFEPADEVDAMHDHLRELNTTIERAAGLVGRSLVADRTQLQVINFFVNDADERRADLFRELRADTQGGVELGAELLTTQCDGEDDWARAREVAEETIQVAYDDYAETLSGMGLDPKPVC